MYNSYNSAMRARFGKKMYKLSLDGGMTCPNRDGTIGTDGCIFCAGGSGQFSAEKSGGIYEQIEKAKSLVSKKAKNCGYIAYFQSYTNTYAPVEYLTELFNKTLSHPEISAIAIGTRPDCLPPETLSLLEGLARKAPLFVELGFQTCHKSSIRYIRRGYDNNVFDNAVKSLKSIGADVTAHMIIGLPGETESMICETAEYIGRSGADGIKFHLLHVLRGTGLENEYLSGNFQVLSLEEYTRILSSCIAHIPPEMVVHRLTGDGDKKLLIAPLWSGNKKRVLNCINKYFTEQRLMQGSLFGKADKHE